MIHELAITGASGFVGHHFVTAALGNPDVKVTLLTRHPEALAGQPRDRVRVCRGDLLDAASLGGFCAAGATVIHLAYLKTGGDANLVAAGNLAAAAIEGGARRLVHCSTAVVVGNAAGAVTEETPAHPQSVYERDKYAVEQRLHARLASRVDLAILRPTEIVGPGGLGLRHLIERVRDRPPAARRLYNMVLGARRLNYVSVYNVVAALLALALLPAPLNGSVFHVSDDDDPDNEYGAAEAIIAAALGRKVYRGPSLPRPLLTTGLRAFGRAADRVYSQRKLEAIGYRKHSTLRATIEDLVAFEQRRPQA